jgi:hypothetical protein
VQPGIDFVQFFIQIADSRQFIQITQSRMLLVAVNP